MQCLYQLLFYY